MRMTREATKKTIKKEQCGEQFTVFQYNKFISGRAIVQGTDVLFPFVVPR
jgi:hypothetical protein